MNPSTDDQGAAAMNSQNSISNALSPRRKERRPLNLVNDLKLLFASLGAGGAAIPLGDNGRAARLLSEYAQSLRRD
jgi:hypothetical protein